MFNPLFSRIRHASLAQFWVLSALVVCVTLLILFLGPPAALVMADQPPPFVTVSAFQTPPPLPTATPSVDPANSTAIPGPSATLIPTATHTVEPVAPEGTSPDDTLGPAPPDEPATDTVAGPELPPSPEATTGVPNLDSGPLQPLIDSLGANPLLIVGTLGIIALLLLLFLWLRRRRSRRSSTDPLRRGTIPPTSGSAPLSPRTEPPPPGTPYLRSEGRTTGAAYYPLSQSELAIGRGPESLLQIDETFTGWPTVSRNHARIEREGRRFVLLDDGSVNGVYVNGQRSGTNLLQDGVTISIGQVPFTFHVNQKGEAM